MFQYCYALITAPNINLYKSATLAAMFKDCTSLQNVPIYQAYSNPNAKDMFSNCPALTDTSLDNILQMCYTYMVGLGSNRKLSYLGFTASNYPASRIQALPHYQDFIDAGWTIGY